MSATPFNANLEESRSVLLRLNLEFFSLLKNRKEVCENIQKLKKATTHFSAYDSKREREIFSSLLKEIKNLSLSELLAFSLIMEEHALVLSPNAYPRWSKRIHLDEKASDFELFELMNPLLLKAKDELLFNKLKLSSEFSFLKDFLFT